MKKITLLAMSLMMTLFVKAQEDVTSLLLNAGFDEQTSAEQTPVTSWEGEFQTQTASYPNFSGTFAEKWCGSYKTGTGQTLTEDGKTYYLLSDFSCSQTIDVENGVYVLGAYVIANNQDLSRLNPVEGVLLCANEDVTSCASGNGVPAWHQVSTVVTDGKLTVALRTQNTTANWVAWDGITLTRYTGETVEEAKLAWVLDELVKISETTVAELLESTIQTSIAAALQASVDAVADVTTYAAGEELLATIKAQIEEANASKDAYAALFAAIEAAEFELDRGFTEGVEEFEAIVAAVESLYNNPTASVEEVEATIAKLNEDIYNFQMLNADGSTEFDVTHMITNPTMRKGNEGWSGSVPGLEYEVMEFYDCNFDMYQELTDLPKGMYVVRVQAFYRTGGNDSGAAYQDGSENITAELYANESSVPLLSMYQHTASEMGVTNDQVLNDYVNMRVAVNEAFNLTNPLTGNLYYTENEVTVLVQDGNLKIGLRNSNHGGASWCAFRDFKLGYYGNFPGAVLLAKVNEAQTWLEEHADELPLNAYSELSDFLMDAEDYTEPGAYEEEEVFAVLAQLEAMYASTKNVIALQNELRDLLEEADAMIELGYPGLDAFVVAYEVAEGYSGEGVELELEEGVTTEQFFQQVIADFKAAIDAYYFSQEASPENPANYTHKIVLPSFAGAKNYTIPAPWVVANVQASGDVWVGPGQPDAAGDGTTNLPCLNSWSNNFTTMDVHQDIEGLPNGIYTVSARAITQGLGQQHAYATSSIGTSVSEDMTIVGWDSYEWETLTTEKVVVVDGKLRIGFASVSAGDVNGWYQVTDFQLMYYGAATDADLEAAWNSSLQRAQEYAGILLPGDSKDVKAAIEAATPLAAEGKYIEACSALNPVVAASDSIFNAVQSFYNGEYQALIDLAASLDYDVNTSSAKLLAMTMQMVGQALHAEDATHKILDPMAAKLAGYVAYATYLIEAENTLASIKGVKEEAKTFVKNQIELQVNDLVAELRPAADCEDLLGKLKKLMLALGSYNLLNLPVGDLTEDLIVNYDIEADANASGWTVVKGDAQNAPTNSGEHYDGSTPSNRYLDAWNPNIGVNNITIYQEIVGLPDGTYQLTVATRTDGDNVYVFASPEALAADTAKWTAATQWDMVKNYGAFGGEIFAADTLLWHELDGVGEFPYMEARGGEGYGWSYNTINVQVTNHYLMIGITANKLLTGQAQFTGTWLGADDWKLVLVEKAAVQSELNPFDGIENVEVAPVKMGTYDLFGRRIDTPTATGIYIVNGKKVFIKK